MLDSTTKRCTKCGEEKPATREFFSPTTRGINGIRAQCKKCCAVQSLAYRNNNLEKARESSLNWNKSNPQKMRETQKRWRANNPEAKKRSNREWEKKNPEAHTKIRRRATVKYRALKANAIGDFTSKDIDTLYKSQLGKCWWCAKKLNGVFEIDHRIALSRGGTNWPNNLCLVCKHCNTSKRDKLPYEWNGRLI